MQNVICFTSDFGIDDTWVGVCHAVIHAACPQARVVDLAHQIPAFDLRKGAAVAAAGVYQLPEAIHLIVVDPGVGGGRRDLCIVANSGTRLVGPDNGVLIPAAERAGGVGTAYAIERDIADSGPALATFHARDVMAPAAAALACGDDPSSLGEPVDPTELAAAPFPRSVKEGEYVSAEIIDIDRFGSVRIGIGAEDVERFELRTARLELSLGHLAIEAPLGLSFSDVEEGAPVALVDSSGWLTLALRMGSAAERYGIEPGAQARVRVVD